MRVGHARRAAMTRARPPLLSPPTPSPSRRGHEGDAALQLRAALPPASHPGEEGAAPASPSLPLSPSLPRSPVPEIRPRAVPSRAGHGALTLAVCVSVRPCIPAAPGREAMLRLPEHPHLLRRRPRLLHRGAGQDQVGAGARLRAPA